MSRRPMPASEQTSDSSPTVSNSSFLNLWTPCAIYLPFCLPIRNNVQHTWVHDLACRDSMMLNFFLCLLHWMIPACRICPTSPSPLFIVSLSHCGYTKYTWSAIRVGSSRSRLLISFFRMGCHCHDIHVNFKKKSHLFDAYIYIYISIPSWFPFFPSFFEQNFCECSFPQ